MAPEVHRNAERGRYEVSVDGTLAGFTEFRQDGAVTVFPHTEIDERFAGQGLAKTLIRAALDDMRSRGGPIAPECEFVRGFIEKNPAYADLIAPAT